MKKTISQLLKTENVLFHFFFDNSSQKNFSQDPFNSVHAHFMWTLQHIFKHLHCSGLVFSISYYNFQTGVNESELVKKLNII